MRSLVRVYPGRVLAALFAIVTMLGVALAGAGPAQAAGTLYARYNTGYPNTYARINYHNASYTLPGEKTFQVSCKVGCEPQAWGELEMLNGDVYHLWVGHGEFGSHAFYSGARRIRICVQNRSCSAWAPPSQ